MLATDWRQTKEIKTFMLMKFSLLISSVPSSSFLLFLVPTSLRPASGDGMLDLDLV